jgi:5'-nucleotidase
MFDLVEKYKIPCLIFSAGVGDTLVEILKMQGCLRSNMHVVSNFMVFDGEGEDAKLKGMLNFEREL